MILLDKNIYNQNYEETEMSFDLKGFTGNTMSGIMGVMDNVSKSAVPSLMQEGVTALAVGATAGLLDMAMGGNNSSPGKVAMGIGLACFAADKLTGGALTKTFAKGIGGLVKGASSMMGMGATAKATP
jgi:hypothetical protein